MGILLAGLRFRDDAPVPSDPLPQFDLPTTDGTRFRTQDIVGTCPLLVITGSFTCPMAAAAHKRLKQLHARYGDRVKFVTLYVREAHPGETYEQTAAYAEKLRYACELKARDSLPWPIAVDDPDGTVHRTLGQRPNLAYLADRHGRIVFRALCAGDDLRLVQALRCVARGETPPVPESCHRLGPLVDGIGLLGDVTRWAGPRARRDVWRAVPPVAALAWVADLYRPLPAKWRVVAALVTVGMITCVFASAARDSHKR